MKKTSIIIASVAAVLMTACDANKAKVADTAEAFVQALTEKDKVSMYELYPAMRTMEMVVVPESLPMDISVKFNETDSTYTAMLDDQKSLVVRVFDDGQTQIIDSYNVLKVDELCYDLAAKTGVPIKEMSDVMNNVLFSNDSEFMQWLPGYSSPIISCGSGYYNWSRNGGRFECRISQQITNNTDSIFEYGDYSINFTFTNKNNGNVIYTHTEPGWSIGPGETRTISFIMNEVYNAAQKRILNWTAEASFPENKTAHIYAKYGKYAGDEYPYFVELCKVEEEIEGEEAVEDEEMIEM